MDDMDYLAMEMNAAMTAQIMGRDQNNMVQRMRELDQELVARYLKAHYLITINNEELLLELDCASPPFLKALVDLKPIKSWAIITAHNPYSKKCSDSENQENNIRLKELLSSHGYDLLPAIGKSPDSDWEEESILILNISYDIAESFGTCFQQNAIVFGELGAPIELIFCDKELG